MQPRELVPCLDEQGVDFPIGEAQLAPVIDPLRRWEPVSEIEALPERIIAG